MNYDPLQFQHRFASGMIVTLSVVRAKGMQPKLSSIGHESLTDAEREEYRKWRRGVVATMMSALNPDEVFALSQKGREVIETVLNRK